MALYDNIHKTTDAGLKPSVVQEFIERTLLENMQPQMVHAMDAQKRTLPLHNGKYVKFRKFDPMPAITTPLSEGVTPDGQKLTMTSFTAMVKPYGGFVELTDEVDLYLVDNISKEAARLLADQAADSLDQITANALNAGINVQYANSRAGRSAIVDSDKVTYAEIKKAVRTLKRNNVKPCSDGYYHAIVHPDVVHDLTSDTMWVDVAKYQDKAAVQQNELGTIYKVKFYESTNAKVFKAKTYVYGAVSAIAANADYVAGSKYLAFTPGSYTGLTEDVARELTGQLVMVRGDSAYTFNCIEKIDVTNGRIYLRYEPASTVYADWTTAKNFGIYPYGGGSTSGGSSGNVYSTLIYGADAFGTIELQGGGNVEVIIHEPGSAGSDDPLNQKGTIGWKVKGYTATILQDDFIIRLESGATQ